MKKWTSRLGGLLVGPALGLTSSVVRSSGSVSLCDIDASPGKYAGKTVRFRLFISNDNGFISACSVCGKEDIAGAGVDLDPQQTALLRKAVHSRTEETGYYVTEAIVVGRFDPPDGMLHCFSPKYHISNARMERVIARHEFSAEQLAEWFKSKGL